MKSYTTCSTTPKRNLINALGHARQRTMVTQRTKIHSISRNTILKKKLEVWTEKLQSSETMEQHGQSTYRSYL